MSESWDEVSMKVESLRIAILAIEKGAYDGELFELANRIYDFLLGEKAVSG